MKRLKIAALGLSMFMLSGCVTLTTNQYSDGWRKYIPTPKIYMRTIYGDLKKGLQGKTEGYLFLTMHPEKLNRVKIYKLNLNKKISGKALDELVCDTYNNVVMGVSKNEIVGIVSIKEKGYKNHPSPPFMEKDGKFTDTKKPYPRIITEAKYVGHILSWKAIQENDGIFNEEHVSEEVFNHSRHYDRAWMGYGTMLFSTKKGKLGPVLHERGGDTAWGSTKGCIALDEEGMKYCLKHTKMGATVRFIYDPVVEYASKDSQFEIIKLGLKDRFKIYKKDEFLSYTQKNEEADLKHLAPFINKTKKLE